MQAVRVTLLFGEKSLMDARSASCQAASGAAGGVPSSCGQVHTCRWRAVSPLFKPDRWLDGLALQTVPSELPVGALPRCAAELGWAGQRSERWLLRFNCRPCAQSASAMASTNHPPHR